MALDPQTDMLITVRDLAELLSVNRRTVWRWLRAGILPRPVRLTTRTVRWRASVVQRFLDDAGTGGRRRRHV
jgi:prophage regulatory protein